MIQRRGARRGGQEKGVKIPKAIKTPSRPVRDVIIRHEPVELASLLKFGDVVSSGGEAKILVQEGMVQVNGETETRRRRKIMAGDVVQIGADRLRARLDPAAPPTEPH